MDTHLLSQAESINEHLTFIEYELHEFLDFTSIDKLLDSEKSLNIEYLQSIFKEFRYLAIFCGEGRQAITKLLKTNSIEQEYFDRVYKGIYYKCIIEYFSPRDEIWFEDSRASYRNKCSIDFQEHPGRLIVETIKKIEPSFLQLREHLDYLEL
ncbi:DUF3907 family protein [Piscibacillus salipiscarius]|uniref:DUF3907 family protein n=1 Tax=Piscibacillus salipiscarius TaxID=299480 RepID=A0ABW5QFE1_9BACI|nr:DUF3907 family protein [Piscibacillus salipiscarius]